VDEDCDGGGDERAAKMMRLEPATGPATEEDRDADAAIAVDDTDDAATAEHDATPAPPIKRGRGRPPKNKCFGGAGGASGAGNAATTPGTKTPKTPKAPKAESTPEPYSRPKRARGGATEAAEHATPAVGNGAGGGDLAASASAAAKARRSLRSHEKAREKARGASADDSDGDDDDNGDDGEVIDVNRRVPLPEGWVPPPLVCLAPTYQVSAELRTFVDAWKLQRKARPLPRHGDGQVVPLPLEHPYPPPALVSDQDELELLAGAAAGPYATLRTLSRTLKLSPFSLDALVAALLRPAPSALVDGVHVAVLAALYSDEVEGNTILPGPASSAPGVGAAAAPSVVLSVSGGGTTGTGGAGNANGNASGLDGERQRPEEPQPEARDTAQYLDTVTWPDYLAALLARTRATRGGRHVPRVSPRCCEYYALPPADKVALLTYLCDELLTTAAVRNELDTREGLDLGAGTDGMGGMVGWGVWTGRGARKSEQHSRDTKRSEVT